MRMRSVQGWLHVLRMIREEVRSEARHPWPRPWPGTRSDATWDRFCGRCTGGKTEEDVATGGVFFPAERAIRTLDEFLKDASRGDGSPARLNEF